MAGDIKFSLPRHLLHDKPRPRPLRQPLGQKRQQRPRIRLETKRRIDNDQAGAVQALTRPADAKLYSQHAAYSGPTKTFHEAFRLRQILDRMP